MKTNISLEKGYCIVNIFSYLKLKAQSGEYNENPVPIGQRVSRYVNIGQT